MWMKTLQGKNELHMLSFNEVEVGKPSMKQRRKPFLFLIEEKRIKR
jgi:hypothetical protein